MKTFRGADIPGVYNLAGLTDKTLYVFRNRFAQYMAITLATYGVFALGIAWAFIGSQPPGLLSDLFSDPVSVVEYLNTYWIYLLLPGIAADFALQQYTSHLVREREIHWLHAVSKTLSVNMINFLIARGIGILILYVVGTVTTEIALVLILGQVIYLQLIAGAYALFSGMVHAIVVEERINFFQAIGRNLRFAGSNLGIAAFGSFAGLMITVGLMMCFILFIYLVGMIVFNLLYGNVSGQQEFMGLLNAIVLYGCPIVVSLFLIPIASIFYSIMYYHFRSQREGFHLENELNIKLRAMKAAQAKEEPAGSAPAQPAMSNTTA